MRWLALCLALIFVGAVCADVQFYLKEGTKKCFIEDLPLDTLVVGEFAANDIVQMGGNPQQAADDTEIKPRKDLSQPLGILVSVQEPNGVNLVDRTYPAKGRFAFTSRSEGEHTICLSTNSSRWFGAGAVKMVLDIESGADTNDYDDIKAMEQLTEIEVYIRRLNDKVVDLRREQLFYKNREEKLRNSSELANASVMWFSFIQTFILIASGLWQIYHLKGFFKAKKMV